ncbi:MAG: sodium:proton antiporter NhaD, partial [Steroidobacteraceae bacterium]
MIGTAEAVLALLIFVVAYVVVIAEEFTHVRKSKPVVIAAGLIWILVAIAARRQGGAGVEQALEHNLLEYAGLLLFLLAAMTYVNVLEERNVFATLRSWMIARGFSLRSIFWLTGLLAFFLSPVLDNLTTALVMGAVALSVGRESPRFLVPACVNIVVAANAGGAFSPFGDITTLMVWQKGVVTFTEFFDLFLPALVNWVVPALCMHFAVPSTRPQAEAAPAQMKRGGFVVILLFGITISSTVVMHQYLHLPSFLGMMTGLGMLMVYGHFIRRQELRAGTGTAPAAVPPGFKPAVRTFDVFISTKRVEWDTLLFFYGVVLCVGGLGALGYLSLLSQHSYASLGPSVTNVAVGLASAVIDNIPIMFAVLSMNPEMSHGQWLLVTLTAGVGGSLLSIGSAAGVALMGQARGVYTFMAHLKWIWAVALGYIASVWVHFQL